MSSTANRVSLESETLLNACDGCSSMSSMVILPPPDFRESESECCLRGLFESETLLNACDECSSMSSRDPERLHPDLRESERDSLRVLFESERDPRRVVWESEMLHPDFRESERESRREALSESERDFLRLDRGEFGIPHPDFRESERESRREMLSESERDFLRLDRGEFGIPHPDFRESERESRRLTLSESEMDFLRMDMGESERLYPVVFESERDNRRVLPVHPVLMEMSNSSWSSSFLLWLPNFAQLSFPFHVRCLSAFFVDVAMLLAAITFPVDRTMVALFDFGRFPFAFVGDLECWRDIFRRFFFRAFLVLG